VKEYQARTERPVDQWAWSTRAVLQVMGRPKPQPRPRGRILIAKRYEPSARFTIRTFLDLARVHMYQPKPAEWRAKIRSAFKRSQLPMLEGPVKVDCTFVMGRPKDFCKTIGGRYWFPRQPDRDNLDKLILDLMQETGIVERDSQICAGSIEKFYSAVGEPAHAEISIATLVRHRRLGPPPAGARP